jgi:uncharacterized RDD family membrane protein YckC
VDTVIASFFALLGFFAVAASADGAALVVLLPVGFMVGGLLYCVPLVHRWGATVGKRIFGLRVVRLWSNGTLPPSWKDAFIREFDKAALLSALSRCWVRGCLMACRGVVGRGCRPVFRPWWAGWQRL